MAGGDNGGSAKPKARGAALQARLDLVESMIVQGWSTGQIRAACAKEWDLSARQAADYVAKVHKRWQSERHRDRPAARERQIRRLMRLWRKADGTVEKNEKGEVTKVVPPDFRALLRIEELLHRIEGTAYLPTDDLAGAGAVDIVIERVRNPDVTPPSAAALPPPPHKEP